MHFKKTLNHLNMMPVIGFIIIKSPTLYLERYHILSMIATKMNILLLECICSWEFETLKEQNSRLTQEHLLL